MTSRRDIWAGMDRLEGKKEGSSYSHLEKEMKRQGYGAKSKTHHSKSQAIRNMIETDNRVK